MRNFRKKLTQGYKSLFLRLSIVFLNSIIILAINTLDASCQTQTGQQVKKVSINFKNTPVRTIIYELRKQSGMNFIFEDSQIDKMAPKTLSLKDVSINIALDTLLKGTGFTYKITGNSVAIVRQMNKEIPGFTVSGVVTDDKKEPLVGVTITIKGTSKGTTTNINGEYTLAGIPDDVTLIFTFIGMDSQEIPVNGRKIIHVQMAETITEIGEVVVTGMFTRRAESFTGSATTFKREELMRAGNQNLIKSLKNLDPAFQISENLEFGSDPNRLPNVQLRGQTSFSNLQGNYKDNPNQPLFILDGFETTIEKVYDLDMNRVASITLLKDAAAKAIYGSKAGSGVVVIETIRPKTGELRVHYSGDYGLEAPDLTSYNLMNAAEKLAYEVKIGMYGPSSYPGIITAEEAYKKVYDDIQRGIDTYWLSQPLRTGFSHKHSLTLEGGDSRMRYQLGMLYNQVAGVMKGSNRNTLNLNAMLSYSYNNLIFRNTMEITRNWAKNSPYGSFSEYTSLNPYWAPRDNEGNLNKTFTVHYGQSDDYGYEEVYNPLYNATLNTKNTTYYTEIQDNFSIDWNINKDFRAVGGFSYVREEDNGEIFYPASHTMFAHYDENGLSDRKGKYTKKDGFSESMSLQAGLNFNKSFDNHLIFANLTYNMKTSRNNATTITAEGFGNDYMDDISFATKYETNGKPSGSSSKTREIGFIGALNYSYANRYLFDASIRKSASSVYGSDNRWGTFWSLGVGWNLHYENFLSDKKWIKEFKLRASMGYTGTQNVDPAASRARYEYYDYIYDDKIGGQLIALPNSKLKWQRNMDYNIGVDITLGRFLTLRTDYYIQQTNDLLSDISLPPSAGFSSYKENLGKIENKGCEIALLLTPWRNDQKQAYVTVSWTALHNENKIKKIYDIFKNSNEKQNSSLDEGIDSNPSTSENMEKYLNKYTKPATLYYEGCSMTAIWGVRSLGISPTTGQEMFLTKDGLSSYTWSSADQVVIGDSEPKLSGNIGVNVGYKGFSFSISASYKVGGDLYNSNLIARVENVTGKENLDRRIQKAWQQVGDIAPYKVTQITTSTNTSYTKPTSRFVQKNNELYISSLNFGYEFQEAQWLKKCALKRLKLSLYMNELWRISSIEIERGTSYPFARNFSFSLQATF